MSAPAETNGDASEVGSSTSQVKVSPDVLIALRDHIKGIGEVLQNLTVGAEDKDESDSDPKSPTTATDDEPGKENGADEKSAAKEEEVEKEEVDGSDTILRKGRVLEVLHKDNESVSSVPTSVTKKRKSIECAFTYVKNVDKGETYKSSLIELYDEDLINALQKVRTESRPSYYREGREKFPGLLFSPYEDIVWMYARLNTFVSESTDLSAKTTDDLKLLLDYVKKDQSLATYFETSEKRPKHIAWDHIWTLFPAGTEVVARPFLDTPQILMIQDPPYRSGADSAIVKYDQSERWNYNGQWGFPEHWRIKAWSYDHDGTDWLRVCHEFTIKKYDGERYVNELKCYPLDKDNESEALRKLRIVEGQRFSELSSAKKPPRFNYDDSVMIDKQSSNRSLFPLDLMPAWYRRRYFDENFIELTTSKVKQEVIIDPEPWNERYGSLHIGPSEPSLLCRPTEKDMHDKAFVPIPEGEMTRFCPPRFIGCLPKDRLIAQFKISVVLDDETRVKKDESLFDRDLQLDKKVKNLLLAQVRYQKDNPTQNTDIIPGKGNNLVVLLHGPPGVGKTLTAETVAKATDRPLLNTTIGDVGTNPVEAEGKLLRIFTVASRWQAILLIDEADAFLEKRDTSALPERNAFVTIMLRILEYHTGIVMLTTNRLATIDGAVQSRIHLAIKYRELEAKDCITIFETSVKKIGVPIKEEKYREIIEWLKDPALEDQHDQRKAWNGREIRNLVTGAVAHMAHCGDKSLTKEHVKTVFNTTREFKKQLEEQMLLWKRDNQGAGRDR